MKSASNTLKFTDEVIDRLFGNEAAENENPAALRAYYFKNDLYEQVCSSLPLRILVGHKGTGKSALFRVAEMEDDDSGVLSVVIKPDDVLGIATSEEDILKLIRDWKQGLKDIIFRKIFEKFDVNEDRFKKLALKGGGFLNAIAESLKSFKGDLNLVPIREKILEKFLEDKRVNIYIDDLDRGWEAKKSDIKRISALLNAARDMSAEMSGINFRISLRTDVYFLVRASDESADKFEGSVIWFKWTNHEVLAMLVKRVNNYFSGPYYTDEELIAKTDEELAWNLERIMEKRFHGKGAWENIPVHRMLLSLIRRRPRDLIKLCSMAAKEAHKNKASLIGTAHFDKIFEQYSQERLQDTVNEFKSEMKNIMDLLLNMRPGKKERARDAFFHYSPGELIEKLKDISGRIPLLFANGKKPDAKELALFLFKINFIHAVKQLDDGGIDRRYYEDNRYLGSIDFGYAWEVHAAYRWALAPESLNKILDSMEKNC